MDSLSTTADGKQLTFRKWSWQGSVYVADLPMNAMRIDTPTRLTLSESPNYPAAWTADSKAVIFQSIRNAEWGIFKQSLNEDTARPIVRSRDVGFEPRVSPDGAWVLYGSRATTETPAAPAKLMRVSIGGGTPQLVLTSRSYSYRCARSPAKLCAIAEPSSDHSQLIFTAFDPQEGRGRELLRFDIVPRASYLWDLSSDGLRIAILRNRSGLIQVLSLNGARPREVVVHAWNTIQSVDWSADGKRLFVAASTPQGVALLEVDLNGIAHTLWEQKGSAVPFTEIALGGPSVPWAVPSPDGRHLAIYNWSMSANIWMIENF